MELKLHTFLRKEMGDLVEVEAFVREWEGVT